MRTLMLCAVRSGWFTLARAAIVGGLVLGSASEAAAAPKRILLLHSFEREFAPFDVISEMFRQQIVRRSADSVTFLDVSVQPVRMNATPDEAPIVEYLVSTFAGEKPDLVVPIGAPAALFAQKYRRLIFPTTPVVFASVDRRFLQRAAFASNDAAVAVSHEPRQLIEAIERLLPRVRNVFIVLGASPFERTWRAVVERELSPVGDRLTLTYSTDMGFGEMLERAGSLPPDSAIVYGIFSVDANGEAERESDVLARLHEVANAPLFGFHSNQMGLGIVGGALIDFAAVGARTADVALEILKGVAPAMVTVEPLAPSVSVFDWRELQRWNISERSLEAGSLIQFRPANRWATAGWPIVVGLLTGLSTAVAALVLLSIHAGRKRSEAARQESEARFRLLADAAPAMVWTSGPDARHTDFNRPWLDFTGRDVAAEIGDGWTDGIHTADIERRLAIYRAAFDRAEPFRTEYRLRRHDGEYRWLLDTGVPRISGNGELLGYIGSCIDITEIRLAQSSATAFTGRVMDAHEQERRQLALELYDDLGQRLAGLTMQMQALTRRPQDGADDVRGRLGELCVQFGDLGTDIRDMAHRLHSVSLEHLGLEAAAAGFCQEAASLHAVEIAFSAYGVPADLPDSVALGIFRVLQEAVTNAARHSGSREIEVTLRGNQQALHLGVTDRGAGFLPDKALASGGMGLLAMRERVRLLHGELQIDSQPGAGTAVRVRVP